MIHIVKHFKINTGQQYVFFMFGSKEASKIKNNKILRWHLELSEYQFGISTALEKEHLSTNTITGMLFCVWSIITKEDSFRYVFPWGYSSASFIMVKNLPYSVDYVKSVCLKCSICVWFKAYMSSYRQPLI